LSVHIIYINTIYISNPLDAAMEMVEISVTGRCFPRVSNCTWSNCKNTEHSDCSLFLIVGCSSEKKCIGKTRSGTDHVQLNTKWEFIYLHYFYRTPTVSSDTIIIINVILRAEWLPITDIRKNADQRKLCTYLRLSIFYNSNENCFQFCEWFLIIIYIIMYSTMLYDNDNNNCYYYNINNIFDYIIIY
jgi:hypothetical protein